MQNIKRRLDENIFSCEMHNEKTLYIRFNDNDILMVFNNKTEYYIYYATHPEDIEWSDTCKETDDLYIAVIKCYNKVQQEHTDRREYNANILRSYGHDEKFINKSFELTGVKERYDKLKV